MQFETFIHKYDVYNYVDNVEKSNVKMKNSQLFTI